MSEILTVHGGMIQGQDHINDNTDQVYVIDVDGDEEYTDLGIHIAKDHGKKTLKEVATEIVESYGKKYGEENE
tara:strand:+ start:220 stop:438 length:219 start_codon:yes stop_codon:yes gene_type:complete